MKLFFTSLLTLVVILTANAQFSETRIIDQCRPCQPKDVQSADFDNDGDNDILIAGFAKGEVAIIRNEGGGVFGEPEIIMTGDFLMNAIYPGDLNNDGWTDIVFAGANGISIGFIRNDGEGNFGNYQTISTSITEAHDISTADLDNDGWLDLVVAARYEDRIYWFRNQAGLGFSNQMILAVNMVSTLGFATGDMDNDGDIDIFIPADAAASTSLSWSRNDGNGNFTTASFPVPPSVAWQVTGWGLGDMDNDGDLDVVTATLVDSRLRWHRNDGDGNFSLPIIIPSGSLLVWPDRLDLADLDNDGDLDIILAAGGSDAALVYANNGNSTFSAPFTIANDLNYVRSVHATALNEDGLIDLVAVSYNDHEVV
ncbi:MAG: VCBS repeat-containing protein, partial [Bacteroidota bacterium]